jgi:hypothetical protein
MANTDQRDQPGGQEPPDDRSQVVTGSFEPECPSLSLLAAQ